jgi:hypothetical protein
MAVGQDIPKAVELNYAPIPARPQPGHQAARSTVSSIPQATGMRLSTLVIGAVLGLLCWAVLILACIYIVA